MTTFAQELYDLIDTYLTFPGNDEIMVDELIKAMEHQILTLKKEHEESKHERRTNHD